jgi:hypothetical protein
LTISTSSTVSATPSAPFPLWATFVPRSRYRALDLNKNPLPLALICESRLKFSHFRVLLQLLITL